MNHKAAADAVRRVKKSYAAGWFKWSLGGLRRNVLHRSVMQLSDYCACGSAHFASFQSIDTRRLALRKGTCVGLVSRRVPRIAQLRLIGVNFRFCSTGKSADDCYPERAGTVACGTDPALPALTDEEIMETQSQSYSVHHRHAVVITVCNGKLL